MRASLLAGVVAALLWCPAVARAQAVECTEWAALVQALADGGDPKLAITLADVGQNTGCYARFLARTSPSDARGFALALQRFESARSDKQSGASAGGAGSTTVVAQGATARVLSVAAEYGAITQTTRDGIVTIRGNLAGLPSALVKRDVFPYCQGATGGSDFCVQHSTLSVLRRVSFGVSFDPSRTQVLTATPSAPAATGSQPVVFDASQGQIAGVNLRVDLMNHRDVTSKDFQDAWAARVGPALRSFGDTLLGAGQVLVDITERPDYDAWRADAVRAIQAAGRDRAAIEAAFLDALSRLTPIARQVPNLDSRLDALRSAFSRFAQAQDELIDSLAEKSVLAVEYTQNRPTSQPRTSNVRGILDYPLSKRTKLVLNAAVTVYETAPANPAVGGRLRDLQFGFQVDHGLAGSAVGPAVLTGAVYVQNQRAAAVLTVDAAAPLPGVSFVGLPDGASEVFTNTGNIVVAQGRLSFTPSEKSMTVPFSVTWSNRTELVDKPMWKAQVGVNYNIDALFAGLSGR